MIAQSPVASGQEQTYLVVVVVAKGVVVLIVEVVVEVVGTEVVPVISQTRSCVSLPLKSTLSFGPHSVNGRHH